jgi:hypothetical protein
MAGIMRRVVLMSWILRAFSTSVSDLTGFISVAMKEQIKQTKIPTAETATGKTMASHPPDKPMEDPRTSAAQVDSAKDPNKSDPIPATSPTLSPTLSAIVAGLRGSSSGIPCTTWQERVKRQ